MTTDENDHQTADPQPSQRGTIIYKEKNQIPCSNSLIAECLETDTIAEIHASFYSLAYILFYKYEKLNIYQIVAGQFYQESA